MSRDLHSDRLGDAGGNHVSRSSSPKIVEYFSGVACGHFARLADPFCAFTAALRAYHLAESRGNASARPCFSEIAYRLAFVMENVLGKSRVSVFAFEDCGGAAPF